MSCTDEGPFDGGVYNNPQINDPEINGGKATNLTLDGSVNATDTAATSLVRLIQEVSPAAVTNSPKQSEGTDVPTIIVGEDRTVILGKPFKWIKCGDGMIPVFRAE